LTPFSGELCSIDWAVNVGITTSRAFAPADTRTHLSTNQTTYSLDGPSAGHWWVPAPTRWAQLSGFLSGTLGFMS
jgi:hypothetical protein